MKDKNIKAIIVSAFAVISIAAVGISPVFAQTPRATSSATRIQSQMNNLVSRADQEITRRITGLNNLASRITSMKRIDSADQANISSSVQSQISVLTSLKTKIDADTDIATLRADVQSITKSYRIYALIIPQGAVFAAADRAIYISGQVDAVSTKLSGRISTAQTAGKDVSAAQASLSDLNAKSADAKTEAQAAVSEVSALKPDNGDQTLLQANTAALKDARSKIQAAGKDLQAARQDATDIIKDLKGFEGGTTPSTTPTSE